MKTFLVIWAGNTVSYTGTAMTRFGLLVWAYQQAGTATALALLGAAGFVPYVALSPFAGALVDRWDRRKVLILADSLTAVLSFALLILFGRGELALWHLYAYEGLTGLLDAFYEPASAASVTVLVPPEQFGRATGLQSLSFASARVLAPALAGLLLSFADLRAVLIIDLLSFGVAVAAVTWARIPRPPASAEGEAARTGRLWGDVRLGFSYIRQRRGLAELLAVFVGINSLAALTYFGVLPAMILARGGRSEITLGAVQTALGVGAVAGGALFSAWGGPRRRTTGFLLATLASFALGDLLFAVGRSAPGWVAGALGSTITIPFITGCYFSLWLRLVPADIQGRVFAARNMLQTSVMPFGYVAGGLLADHVFEPALMPGGALVPFLGRLVGVGPGAGMGAMFLFTCAAGTALGILGFRLRSLRRLDEENGRYRQAEVSDTSPY